MIAVGCDVSTKRLAFGGIKDTGEIITRVYTLDHTRRGARRLVEARSVAYMAFSAYQVECATVMVEEPARGELTRVAVVVSEAAQAALPGALVWTVVPTTWKRELLGHGHAGKPQSLEFAYDLGYDGDDDDIADALCLAQTAWGRWHGALGEEA